MRDSFIALLFIAGIISSYAYLKRTGYVKSSLEYPHTTGVSRRASRSQISAKKGVKQNDEAANRNHHRQDPQHGKAQGSSGDFVETEGLPSIYEGEGLVQTVRSDQPVSVAESAEIQKTSRVGRPAIPGVPARAFVAYRRKMLPLRQVVRDDTEGMRVFVQCMELKGKGPEYLGANECEKLLANKPSTHSPHY